MVKAIINAKSIIEGNVNKSRRQIRHEKIRADGTNLADCIDPSKENITIIMELYKYFGKEFNLVIVYELFKKINMTLNHGGKNCEPMYSVQDIRRMFHVALQNLKYMGFFSPTKASIFLFKKNFYGKASSGMSNSSYAKDENVNIDNMISQNPTGRNVVAVPGTMMPSRRH